MQQREEKPLTTEEKNMMLDLLAIMGLSEAQRIMTGEKILIICEPPNEQFSPCFQKEAERISPGFRVALFHKIGAPKVRLYLDRKMKLLALEDIQEVEPADVRKRLAPDLHAELVHICFIRI